MSGSSKKKKNNTNSVNKDAGQHAVPPIKRTGNLGPFLVGLVIAGASALGIISLTDLPYKSDSTRSQVTAASPSTSQIREHSSRSTSSEPKRNAVAKPVAIIVAAAPVAPVKSDNTSQKNTAGAGAGFTIIDRAHAQSVSPSLIKQGQRLFKENCQVCHQADAIGKPGVAPSLTNNELLSISSDKFLLGTIRDGREDTGMPPFAHLGRSKVQSIVAFLRSHQTIPSRANEIDNQPDAHGDPRLGQQWYNNICSTCHGVGGNGYEAGGTGTAIGLPGFLNKVTDGFLRETIKRGRSNTRMLGFQGPTAMANLSDQEVDDIIVYLRGLAK